TPVPDRRFAAIAWATEPCLSIEPRRSARGWRRILRCPRKTRTRRRGLLQNGVWNRHHEPLALATDGHAIPRYENRFLAHPDEAADRHRNRVDLPLFGIDHQILHRSDVAAFRIPNLGPYQRVRGNLDSSVGCRRRRLLSLRRGPSKAYSHHQGE